MFLAAVASLVLIVPSIVCQDLSVPSTWRVEYFQTVLFLSLNETEKTIAYKKDDDTSLSRDDRVSIAQAAIDKLTPQLNSSIGEFNGLGYWQSGNVWTAQALKDLIAGTTVNQASVTKNLALVAKLHPSYYKFECFNDDAQWWATAAIYAFRAYKTSSLLDLAVTTWNTVNQYVITANDAASGTISTKSFPISGMCNGITMAGGVFWQQDPNDTSVNAITTGLYVTLSAYLAEATGDAKYIAAAKLSQQFIVNHLYANSLALDTISGKASDACSVSSPLFTYNSGKFIEGLSVLYSVTQDNTYQILMINTIAAATHSTSWQGDDGIITEGSSNVQTDDDGKGFKAIFIRGLYEAFSRNPSNTELRTLVHSYVDVQYNALLDLATTPGTNSYSPAWRGPPATFTTWGQLAALDVLNSAIGANS